MTKTYKFFDDKHSSWVYLRGYIENNQFYVLAEDNFGTLHKAHIDEQWLMDKCVPHD